MGPVWVGSASSGRKEAVGGAASTATCKAYRETADGVFRLVLDVASERGTVFVLVSHDEQLPARCERMRRLVQDVLNH